MKRKFIFNSLVLTATALVGIWVQPATAEFTHVTAVSAGGDHTCALTTLGGVKCWGDNYFGGVGATSTIGPDPMWPLSVPSLRKGVIQVSAGESHTCAVTSAGAALCWGLNDYGQLGDGTTDQRNSPVLVQGLESGVTAVSSGASHTCAITSTGVKCWGYNYFGQLGNGSNADSHVPVSVNINGATAISAADRHTCAVVSGGVKCWGSSTLGDGTDGYSFTPVDVVGLMGATSVAASGSHTCAVDGGAAKCWGGAALGQDDYSIDYSSIPLTVKGLSAGVTAIASGDGFSCAIVGGSMKCWGQGAIGNGYDSSQLPADVTGLGTVTAMTAGRYIACAVTPLAGVKCWGRNQYAQLGDGTKNTDRLSPVDVVGRYDMFGIIKVGSTPLQGVRIAGGSEGEQYTDSNGFYVFAEVLDGTSYLLAPYKAGYTFSPARIDNLTAAGDSEHNFTASPAARPKNCYSLSVTIKPKDTGTVSQKPAPNCSGIYYKAKTKVTLKAKAATGHKFKKWSGAAKGTKASVKIVMSKNLKVTSTFK